MLWGKILRSPHAHARIVSIDTSKAAGAAGREGRRHRGRLPGHPLGRSVRRRRPDELPRPVAATAWRAARRCMKAMRSPPSPPRTQAIADQALALIDVKYEVLPYVIDVEDGDGAGCADPARRHVHRGRRTRSRPSRPTSPRSSPSRRATSRPASRKPRSSSRAATPPSRCTRPISSRMPAWRPTAPDGQITIHSSSQGHFMVRAYTAKLLGIDMSNIRVQPGRNRRRLRRQDAGLPGAGGGRAVEEVRPLGEDADDAGGRLPRLRPDLRRHRWTSRSVPRRTARSSRPSRC